MYKEIKAVYKRNRRQRVFDTGHRIIFITGNEGKVREVRLILADLRPPILSIKKAGAEPEIVESGSTFGENAETKTRAVWNLTGDIALADDSGLEADYIGEEPGIYSARYLGGDTPYVVKNRSIIEHPKETGGQECSARFVCNTAATLPGGQVFHTEVVMEGLITGGPAREGGFGYNPILYLPKLGETSAEVTMDQKNEISHRGKALRVMGEALEDVLK